MIDLALTFSTIIQLILITGICFYEANLKSPVVFLWATLEIMFGVMHFANVLHGDLAFNELVMTEASIFVVLFCVTYFLIRIISRPTYKRLFTKSKTDGIKNSMCYENIFFLLLIISSVVSIVYIIKFSGGLLNTSWGGGREYTNTLGYVNSSQILMITFFSTSGILLYNMLNNNFRRSIICVAIIMSLTIITRNRILILPVIVSVILEKLISIRKINVRHILYSTIAAITVIYIVYSLRVFRHYGSIESFVGGFDFIDFNSKVLNYLMTDNGELGLRNDFYFFIHNRNDFYGFGECASYVRMLLVYIPTSFSFGLKPDDFAITMGQAIGMAPGGSTHPTLFGDCYANGGFIGFLLGAFWAIYASVADFIILKTRNRVLQTLIYVLFSITFIIQGRGSVYNSFFYVAWGIPLIFVLNYICKKVFCLKISVKG